MRNVSFQLFKTDPSIHGTNFPPVASDRTGWGEQPHSFPASQVQLALVINSLVGNEVSKRTKSLKVTRNAPTSFSFILETFSQTFMEKITKI